MAGGPIRRLFLGGRMDNKNVNQNRDFSQKQEPKKGFGQKIGDKMERLGDKFSRKGERSENSRDSQR
jgi:hypothetical protein